MKLINKLILFVAILTIAASCSKKPDVEYTTAYKLAGEWYTRYYNGGAAITPYHKIISYNTAANTNEIWVDDLGTWPFKSKLTVDLAALGFTPLASTPNTKLTGKTVKVIEGKVIPGAGVTKSGNAVDSIYLKLEFSDDPGEIYEVKGHQRTGFFEDEY